MNFLAHIYLSGHNKDVALGNFIADRVKGKDYKNYPKDIQIGILLHREIDAFTDTHPIVRQSKKRLYKKYRHYAGVIVDILYDHFLAKNWKKYSSVELEIFVDDFYTLLQDNFEILPERIKYMTQFLIKDNWLLSYVSTKGIEKALVGMNRRTQGKSKMNESIEELNEYYNEFENEFTDFFEELIAFSNDKLKILSSLT